MTVSHYCARPIRDGIILRVCLKNRCDVTQTLAADTRIEGSDDLGFVDKG